MRCNMATKVTAIVGWRFRLVPILTGRASNSSRSVSVVEGEKQTCNRHYPPLGRSANQARVALHRGGAS
jgi:hypothetical protein